ncbi:MAG: AIR synthase family protein [Syntrophobacterales bacterium]|nr:MAG: AIR synthase family protein [Syntrophobacterales bacterium]
MVKKLPLGKLNFDLLERLLGKYPGVMDERLVVGPRVGEDAAVIDFPDRYLVAKTDPITYAMDEIGWYAVHINANDVAIRGAKPRWFQPAILLPEGRATEDVVEEIFGQISRACRDMGITIVGGHTEISPGLDRPIVVGSMFGEVEKAKLVTTSGARTGDNILLTKGIVIEGTAIIAREKREDLRKRGYDEGFLQRCMDYLYEPGISVVKDALLANQFEIHSMHDPTEGGLATGLYEMARASRVGMLIYGDKIDLLPDSERLCAEYGLNPLGTITSGSLVLAADPENAQKVLEAYLNADIRVSVIGRIEEKSFGIKILRDGKIGDLKWSEKDEITRIFE